MKILIITAGYPTIYNPLDGIFHKDQAIAIAESNDVSLIAISAVSIKNIIKIKKFQFGYKKYTDNNVQTYHYICANIPFYLQYSILKFKKTGKILFEKYLQENTLPDIIHLQCFEAILLAVYIKQKYNIPFVITEHSSRFNNNTLPNELKKYTHLAFSESACNITVSEELASKMSIEFQKKFTYIPNIVNTDFFIPGISKKDKFTLVNIGGLIDIKNHQLLIKAFSLAHKKINNLQLIIIGHGPLKDELLNLVKKLQLESNITFLGYLDREEILRQLQSAHCFVLSSKSETFGVAIVEAMSCGLPVVSTISSGPKSIIKDENLGLLSEHNPETLAEKIILMYNNYKHYSASYIRKYTIENFSKLAVCKSILNTYKKALKTHYD